MDTITKILLYDDKLTPSDLNHYCLSQIFYLKMG